MQEQSTDRTCVHAWLGNGRCARLTAGDATLSDAVHGCWLVGEPLVLSGDLRFSGEAGGPSVHGIDLVVGRGCANLVFTQEIVVWSRTHASFLVWNQ
jgi:hypothetical protein